MGRDCTRHFVQNFKDKADDLKEQVQEQATDLSSAAQGKLDDLLDDYKRILPMVEELGLRVSSFHIEAGLTSPRFKKTGILWLIHRKRVKTALVLVDWIC
ncbi:MULTISPECIES: YtxH domain-containing protein [Spirulina sp. CCY15215]|uniref:YtxH domain-containing protein n=1 Tax=Spirulina sp. CCY15215 TaxID=2767591 RepID=UPI001950E5A8|nr:YtxH domain-containing protein [Spirulina major]